jgi:long-chain fatty acid transport protein
MVADARVLIGALVSGPFALVATFAPAARAGAQPMDTYGMGARSVALGGAVTADVADFSANYYNPAGLVRGEEVRIGLGWFGAHHELSIDRFDSNVDGVHGLLAGLVVPGRIDAFRFAFGLGVHLPDDRVSRTRTLPRSRPRWEFYDNRPQRAYLAAHLAVRPFDWLLIGGGIAFLSYSSNSLSLRGDIDALRPEGRTALEHEVNADLTTIRYPQVGVQVIPIPELSFGLVYRGQFSLNNRLVAQVGMDSPASDTRIVVGNLGVIPGYFRLVSESVNAFVPEQISLAGSWRPMAALRISAEITWVHWSAYVSPIGSSDIDLVLYIPDELRDLVRPPADIRGSEPVPALFEDRFVPRVGVEGIAVSDPRYEVTVRGGAFYESSPVPEQRGISNLVDCDRIALNLGAGIRLTDLRPLIEGWIAFDLYLQYAALPERLARKESAVDPVGDWRASGHIFAAGLMMEVGFR